MTNRALMTISMPKSAARNTSLAMRRHQGASMIEVLVSILLVSVGLLGIAGLSGASFSFNKTSQIRLTGIALANDLADRARLNVHGYDLGAYDIAQTTNFATTPIAVPTAIDLDPNPIVNPNVATIANNLAAYDVDQFLRSVASRLPQGDAIVVSRPTGTTRDLDVWLLWQEPDTTGGTVGAALLTANEENCPTSLTAAQLQLFNCMYFKVGL
jgi:type IV pilus assembly protein PilV